MKELYKEDKKSFYLIMLGIIVIVAMIGITFAYFIAQGGTSTTRNINVTSNTTDLLTFEIEDDIYIHADDISFAPGAGNAEGETTVRANLLANNYNHLANEKYNLYIDITENPFVYSNSLAEPTGEYNYLLADELDDVWCVIQDDIENYLDCFSTQLACNQVVNEGIWSMSNLSCTLVSGKNTNYNDIKTNNEKRQLLFGILKGNGFISDYGYNECEGGDYSLFVPVYACNDINIKNNINNGQWVSNMDYFGYENACQTINGGETICPSDYDGINTSFWNAIIDELLDEGLIRQQGCFSSTDSLICYRESDSPNHIGGFRISNFPGKDFDLIQKNIIILETNYLQLLTNSGYLNRVPVTESVDIPELLLQVTPPTGVTWNGINSLEYVTVTDGEGNDISGYDITGVEDLVTIASNFDIEVTASDNGEVTHEWGIKIILVNLDQDQVLNAGKEVVGEIRIEKVPKVLPYTGIAYRSNYNNLANGESILPGSSVYCPINEANDYNGCDDNWHYFSEQSCLSDVRDGYTCEEYQNVYCIVNGNQNSCILDDYLFVNEEACENELQSGNDNFSCVSYSVSDLELGGIGEYYTSVNNYLNDTKYCVASADDRWNACNIQQTSGMFETEQECLNYIESSVNNGDMNEGDYKCVVGTTPPIYLKHEVTNDVINNTEACLYYNNTELCIEPNYWVENDSDGSLTMAKLKNAFEDTFGITIEYDDYDEAAENNADYYCESYGDSVNCGILFDEYFYELFVGNNGMSESYVRFNGYGYNCDTYSNGSSYCSD